MQLHDGGGYAVKNVNRWKIQMKRRGFNKKRKEIRNNGRHSKLYCTKQ